MDRANAEDAVLPIPKILNLHEEKDNRHRSLSVDTDDVMADSIDHGNESKFVDGKGRFSSNFVVRSIIFLYHIILYIVFWVKSSIC